MSSAQLLYITCRSFVTNLAHFGGKRSSQQLQHLRSIVPIQSTVSANSMCSCSLSATLNGNNCGLQKQVNQACGSGSYGYTDILRRDFVGFSGIKYKRPNIFQADKKKDQSHEILVKGDKVLKLKLKAVRLDFVLKAGLQISRNKIEKTFYEDRLRLNGERPRKKSQIIHEGDEIDIIRGYNEMNPEHLDVTRIEVVLLGEEEDTEGDERSLIDDDDDDSSEDRSGRIPATLKRFKRLTIENYEERWKGPVDPS